LAKIGTIGPIRFHVPDAQKFAIAPAMVTDFSINIAALDHDAINGIAS
jgi:hypothetical protein